MEQDPKAQAPNDATEAHPADTELSEEELDQIAGGFIQLQDGSEATSRGYISPYM